MRNRPKINIPCERCKAPRVKFSHHVKHELKLDPNKKYFCSKQCESIFTGTVKECNCLQCGETFLKRNSEIKKSPNHFCSSSCSSTYNNTNKTHGTRRSKLEIW